MIIKRIITGLSFAWCALCSLGAAAGQTVTVGSKNFGESYLLAEIAAQVLEAQGFRVNRKLGLGGTLICYEALKNAEIDLYPEYTGTLSQAVLNLPGNPDRSQINRVLADQGLELLAEYGFNNTYAIVVRDEQAQQALGALMAPPCTLLSATATSTVAVTALTTAPLHL